MALVQIANACGGRQAVQYGERERAGASINRPIDLDPGRSRSPYCTEGRATFPHKHLQSALSLTDRLGGLC